MGAKPAATARETLGKNQDGIQTMTSQAQVDRGETVKHSETPWPKDLTAQ